MGLQEFSGSLRRETLWASGEGRQFGAIWTIGIGVEPVRSKLFLLLGLQVGDFYTFDKIGRFRYSESI
jgi:hypothetical protein